jgi:Ubiquitin-activating enzyme active site
MCTLRNFPHLTDHCIEWSRDQFELLFKKLGKSCETFLADPAAFTEDKKAKAGSESGLAIFDVRSVTSMLRAAADPSMGSIAQLSYDIFHFMFRDRILDLQVLLSYFFFLRLISLISDTYLLCSFFLFDLTSYILLLFSELFISLHFFYIILL